MAQTSAFESIATQFETIFSCTDQSDFISSIHFSQSLEKVLVLLSTEDGGYERVLSQIQVLKLATFGVIVSENINIPRVLSAPRTRLVSNILQSLEIVRCIASCSFEVCKELNDKGVINIFLPQLDLLSSYSSAWREENICRLTRTILDILSGINRRISAARATFRSADGVRIFLALTSAQDESVCLNATLLLSHIISERENDYINAAERHMRLVLNSLSRSVGQRRSEILQGLKTLISHDRNKDFFVRNHLPLLLEENAIKNSSSWSPGEEATVYEVLWILTFNTACREEISKCKTLMKTMKMAAKNGRSDSVRCNAKGVLWKIKESTKKLEDADQKVENTLTTDSSDACVKVASDEEDEDDDDDDDDDDENQFSDNDDDVVDSILESQSDSLIESLDKDFVLLTFMPSSQNTFDKLQVTLKEAGYVVISRCSLKDASIQSMALTVRSATAIIFEVSPSSKCCAWFREVIQMSHRLQKTIIPLLLEEAYTPDGWLGFVCGSNLIYDMYDDDCFQSSLGKIFMELNQRGKRCCKYQKVSETGHQSSTISSCVKCAFEVRHISSVEKATEMPSYRSEHRRSEVQDQSVTKSNSVLSWTRDQVGQWLLDLGIPAIVKEKLAAGGLDGNLLLSWYNLLMEAPNVFYQNARQELSLGLVASLRLTSALRSMFEGSDKKTLIGNYKPK